ncbi:hypothetical protein HY734_01850 [Candidatus Uhrbacteria bacterium]|nr:hypothetical protein [Candidatus Uhrbacteria bacterium]
MYLYVYDESAQERPHAKEVLQIEHRLADLGIAGKAAHLGLFKQVDDFIRQEAKRGATTVVAVGNDRTVQRLLSTLLDVGLVFGLIPLGPDNQIARVLGIPAGVVACDVLSARMTAVVDVGVLNDKRFLREVHLPHAPAEIVCEGAYRVIPDGNGSVTIRNLSQAGASGSDVAPQDGRLEAIIRVRGHAGSRFGRAGSRFVETRISFRSLTMRHPDSLRLLVDGVETEGTRWEVGVEPGALKVITGKDRLFLSP